MAVNGTRPRFCGCSGRRPEASGGHFLIYSSPADATVDYTGRADPNTLKHQLAENTELRHPPFSAEENAATRLLFSGWQISCVAKVG